MGRNGTRKLMTNSRIEPAKNIAEKTGKRTKRIFANSPDQLKQADSYVNPA